VTRFAGVIPCRYGSTRFPGKPLALILGKPMFWHVYQRAMKCAKFSDVVVATDNQVIFDRARGLAVPCLMTRSDHPSGSDRVYEAACALGLADEDVVVNIQGDEPALDPAMLDEVLASFDDPAVQVATLARPCGLDEAESPDRVKVVLAKNGAARYFSRSLIPHDGHGRPGPGGESMAFLTHVGLYAFRLPALRQFTRFEPTPLERRECLEQLRFLENGIPIRVRLTTGRAHGVDRPEDIAILTELLLKE